MMEEADEKASCDKQKEEKQTAIGEKTNPAAERRAWLFVSVCHSAA